MTKAAVNRSRKTLDYRKADHADRGRTVLRRKFAAGFLLAGGRVTHISRAELAKVRRYVPRRGPSPLAHADLVHTNAQTCRGLTKTVTSQSSKFDNRFYLNSCDTSKLVLALDMVIIVAGLLAATTPASVIAVAVAAVVAVGKAYVDYCSRRSDISAIMIRDHWHLLTCKPQ